MTNNRFPFSWKELETIYGGKEFAEKESIAKSPFFGIWVFSFFFFCLCKNGMQKLQIIFVIR